MSRPQEPPEAVPPLETERLFLRSPRGREARVVLAFVRENADHLRPFEPTRLAPRYLRIAGQWRDHVQTQRTNEGWREP